MVALINTHVIDNLGTFGAETAHVYRIDTSFTLTRKDPKPINGTQSFSAKLQQLLAKIKKIITYACIGKTFNLDNISRELSAFYLGNKADIIKMEPEQKRKFTSGVLQLLNLANANGNQSAIKILSTIKKEMTKELRIN